MRQIDGDLVAMARRGDFDVIVHGCNCFHAMGAGIAAQIAHAFPQALAADRATRYGARSKLGQISTATHGPCTIVNAYTQFHWSGTPPLVDLVALKDAFDRIAQQFPNQRIGYPKIGAGLAGGHWPDIAPIIDTSLAGLDHCLVTLPPALKDHA